MKDSLRTALNRLAKWRATFASWQLGTRLQTDAECAAIRDHREVTIMLRAEVSALTQLLIAKGVFTFDEFQTALEGEANALDALYESKFPGFTATDSGMSMKLPEALDTMRRMNWKP